jgi:hypothetical protein
VTSEEQATAAATAVLSRVLRERDQLLEQVTALQTRCGELLEEARAARRELPGVWRELGEQERAVVLAIAERLAMGRRQYGPLDVAGDPRDWRKEASEEALDCAVYLACEVMRGKP